MPTYSSARFPDPSGRHADVTPSGGEGHSSRADIHDFQPTGLPGIYTSDLKTAVPGKPAHARIEKFHAQMPTLGSTQGDVLQ